MEQEVSELENEDAIEKESEAGDSCQASEVSGNRVVTAFGDEDSSCRAAETNCEMEGDLQMESFPSIVHLFSVYGCRGRSSQPRAVFDVQSTSVVRQARVSFNGVKGAQVFNLLPASIQIMDS